MVNFNASPIKSQTQTAPTTGGQSGKADSGKTRFADKPLVRSIPKLTNYNSETGLLDTISTWESRGQEERATEAAPSKDSVEKTVGDDRLDAWRTEQAEKKAEQKERKAEKAAKQQLLAKDFLRKGDLVSAANALGMTPSDLAAYVDNARLQIPNEAEKELSPSEKKANEEAQFRKEVEDFKREQQAFKYQTIASSYIKENIDPILSDRDKFEYIHNADVSQIKNYVYEFMNDHFRATGEELKASDVLETIEEQMFQAHISALEKAKQIKKVAKYFSPEEAKEDSIMEESPKTERRSISMPSAPSFKESRLEDRKEKSLNSRFIMKDEELDELLSEAEEQEELNTIPATAHRRTSNKTPNFAFLSRQERLNLIRAGK
jgi:hypothetical protein